MFEFRDYIIGYTFGIYTDESMYGNYDLSNKRYLRKYQKNVDITEQDLSYDKFASEYSLENNKEIIIFLIDGKIYNLNTSNRFDT